MEEIELGDKTNSRKVDPGAVVLVILFLAIIIYAIVRKRGIDGEATYTKGIIINMDEGVHGHLRLNYFFFAGGEKYKNSVSARFCNECDTPCCNQGDSVIVRYQKNNPNNNELLHHLPEDATLTY